MGRTILHYDMDAFYASIEIRDNPKLKKQNLVVGTSVVTTASYEARKFGIHSGMSVMEARKLCKNLKTIPVDKDKYIKVSNFIHSLIEKVTDKVEYIAFDEGFLDITEIIKKYPSKEYFAKKFKERIYKNTLLTCSVGIGYNKLTAKIASDINKPNGFYIFNNSEEFISYVKDKNIKIIPGVGKKFRAILAKDNIFTPLDVYNLGIHELIAKYGTSRGLMLYYYTRGLDDSKVLKERKNISIGNENTYKFLVDSEEDLKREYILLFERTYKRLIKKNYLCNSVGIKIRYNDFLTINRSKNINFFTDDKNYLFEILENLVELIETKKNIRLVGISFNNLVRKDSVKNQLPLKIFK